MEDNGPSSKSNKPNSSTLSRGPLDNIEQQGNQKLNSYVPRLGDIWVIVKVELESCCAQFYKLEMTTTLGLKIDSLGQYMQAKFHFFYVDLLYRILWQIRVGIC